MVKWYHHVGDFANVFKAFVGTNYLACAYAFKISGLGLGGAGLLLIAILTDHCCHLLVQCKYAVIDKFTDDEQAEDLEEEEVEDSEEHNTASSSKKSLRSYLLDGLDYADIGYLTFGKWGALIINICLITTQIGFCVGYFIFIGNTVYSLFPECLVNATMNSSLEAVYSDTYDEPLARVKDSLPQLPTQLPVSNETTGILSNSSTMMTTVMAQTTLTVPNTTVTVPSTTVQSSMLPVVEVISTAPPLPLMVLLPLPFFLLFTLFRTVRQLSVLSVIANSCVAVGFFSILTYLITDFQIAPSISWMEWATVLIFLSQTIAAYEGIGTILPIEASMRENEGRFVPFLHCAVALLTSMIAVIAVLGYLHYGPDTQQIILQNLPSGSVVTICINALLLVGIVCTYPLQVFPVVAILERLLFGLGAEHMKSGRSEGGRLDPGTDDSKPLLTDGPPKHVLVNSVTVPTWKRNVLRVLLPVAMCGLAVALRNVFAYTSALVGAVGSSPLMFIIPCLLHLKLRGHVMSKSVFAKDVVIILFGTMNCIAGTILTVREIIRLA